MFNDPLTSEEWRQIHEAFEVPISEMVRSGRRESYLEAVEFSRWVAMRYNCVSAVSYVDGSWCVFHDPKSTIPPKCEDVECEDDYSDDSEGEESEEEYRDRVEREEYERVRSEIQEEITWNTLAQNRSNEDGWYYDDGD